MMLPTFRPIHMPVPTTFTPPEAPEVFMRSPLPAPTPQALDLRTKKPSENPLSQYTIFTQDQVNMCTISPPTSMTSDISIDRLSSSTIESGSPTYPMKFPPTTIAFRVDEIDRKKSEPERQRKYRKTYLMQKVFSPSPHSSSTIESGLPKYPMQFSPMTIAFRVNEIDRMKSEPEIGVKYRKRYSMKKVLPPSPPSSGTIESEPPKYPMAIAFPVDEIDSKNSEPEICVKYRKRYSMKKALSPSPPSSSTIDSLSPKNPVEPLHMTTGSRVEEVQHQTFEPKGYRTNRENVAPSSTTINSDIPNYPMEHYPMTMRPRVEEVASQKFAPKGYYRTYRENVNSISPPSNSTTKSDIPNYPMEHLPMMGSLEECLSEEREAEAYMLYRERVLPQIQRSQKNNENMRRTQPTDEVKDPIYLEKRKKNNEAAKKSRDARRAKEEEIFVRVKFLESRNDYLKARLLEAEAEKIRLWKLISARKWNQTTLKTHL